jgi:hypothetical protein
MILINTHTEIMFRIKDKLVFPNLISRFVKSPAVLAVIQQGVVVPYGSTEPGLNSKDFVITYLRETGPLVLKPIGGDGGIGIIKVQYIHYDTFEVNQETRSSIQLGTILNGLHNYLVSEFVVQAPYATNIYPKSVNTVRVLTMIDPITQEPFIAAAAHRIGNDYSYPVDNCGRGGFTARIDIETGCLGKAVSVKRFTKELEWHSHHPDSGQLIEGVFVPAWTELKKTVLQMADAMPFSPYLGWDIVITEDSFSVLEANDGPDLKLHQVHKPLLLDERVKQFYAMYKVI